MPYLALQKTDKISAAIVNNAPSDLFGFLTDQFISETHVFAQCIPNYWENKEIELMKRSTIYWPQELNKHSSLLILSGRKHEIATSEQSLNQQIVLRN